MANRTLSAMLATAVCLSAVAGKPKWIPDYNKITEKAQKEYLQPVRPCNLPGNPDWNTYAKKFIYAPVFSFPGGKDVKRYVYRLTQGDKVWEFSAKKPNESLAPVWNKIPVGNTCLTVLAIGKNNVVDTVGTRKFFRDFPFEGPYTGAMRDYRQAARKAAYQFHHNPFVKHWKTHDEPDMNWHKNTYPAKIVGSTVRMECLVAREFPELRDEAVKMAENAVGYLLKIAQAADAPLAYFPPTYYKEPSSKNTTQYRVYQANKNNCMFLEAVYLGEGLLDLYELTGKQEYLDYSKNIARTYVRRQNHDGSWPVKVNLITGEPLNDARCTPATLFDYLNRLSRDYGMTELNAVVSKGENWMNSVALPRFDLSGQFEDVSVDMKPYENLNSCTSSEYAIYLLSGNNPDRDALRHARDLTLMVEDQFCHWDVLPDAKGFQWEPTPCVHEQFKYEMPIDNSTALLAGAFLSLYQATGNDVYLAKARALLDSIVNAESVINGELPTIWDFNGKSRSGSRSHWSNCTFMAVTQLMRMADFEDAHFAPKKK